MKFPQTLVLLGLACGLVACKKVSSVTGATPPAADKTAAGGTATTAAAPAPAGEGTAIVSSSRWPHVGSDLKPDPSITWGALPNGLRFAVMPNAEPPEKISLRLFVEAGSMMERDDQQGLAHFLEHMAFNGTKDFPAGQMVEYFQRLGMGFGADTNAHTSFKETVYKLELPNRDEKLLHDGLLLLRDMADGMLLDAKEIDKERGIILSEKLARDTVEFRTMMEGMKFTLPDALITKRMPIGVEEVISTAPRERFTDFYQKFYTADRMVVVAVGAVEPGALSKRIAETFGSMAKRERAAAPDPGLVTRGRGVQSKVHLENESGYSRITFSVNAPHTPRPDTAASRKEDLPREIANRIVSRRFEILSKEKDAPLLQGRAEFQEFLQFVDSAEIEIIAQPERWNDAVVLAARELRRAREFGFTAAELKVAKADFLAEAENEARSAKTRKSKDLSTEIVSALAEGKVFTNPQEELPRMKANVEALTKEECLEAFKKTWSSGDLSVFATGKMIPPQNGETVEGALARGMKAEISAPTEAAAVEWGYASFGPVGKVAEKKEVADLGITQLVFANGVRVNLKPTDFKKDSVLVSANFGTGRLSLPKDKPGLELYTSQVFDAAGLGKHSVDDLQRVLAGQTVGAQFMVDDDTFALLGETTREDLTVQLQLLCAFFSDPGWRDEADRMLRQSVDAIYSKTEHAIDGVRDAQAEPYLHGGDYRFAFPKREELLARKMDDAKAWLAPALASSPLEVGIVGDFDVAAATTALEATFGALAPREAPGAKPAVAALPAVPAGQKLFPYESKIAKGMLTVHFPTADRSDIKRTRRLQVLASILGDRLRQKIREEWGDSYSPRAVSVGSDTFPGYGFLVAQMVISPPQADAAAAAVKEIAGALAGQPQAAVAAPGRKAGKPQEMGISADELDRARAPLLNALKEQRRNNTYWLQTVAATCQRRPERLDWARTLESDVQAVTKDELEALAKQYLPPARAIEVLISPPITTVGK